MVMHTTDGTEDNHVLFQFVQMRSNLFGRGQTCADEGCYYTSCENGGGTHVSSFVINSYPRGQTYADEGWTFISYATCAGERWNIVHSLYI